MACANCRSRRRARAILNAPSGTPRLVRESPWSVPLRSASSPPRLAPSRARPRAPTPAPLARFAWAPSPRASLRGARRGCVTAPCAAAVSSLASARATPRGRSTPWNSRNAFRCVSRRRTREAPAVFYLRRRAPPSDGAGDETSNDRPLGWCGSAEKDGRTSEPRASWFIACVRDSATALPRHVTLSCPRVPARVSRCSAISR